MIRCDGKRTGTDARAEIMAQVAATDLHRVLIGGGFHLLPFRLPRGLAGGDLRLRLVWRRHAGAETQTVRFTHVLRQPERA